MRTRVPVIAGSGGVAIYVSRSRGPPCAFAHLAQCASRKKKKKEKEKKKKKKRALSFVARVLIQLLERSQHRIPYRIAIRLVQIPEPV